MFTLDEKDLKRRKMTGIRYFSATVFCFLFQLIYEYFSHGVKSNFMMYAFLIPLLAGLISMGSFSKRFGQFAFFFREMIAGGAIWLTLGCIFTGILEIYGTTNSRIVVFWIVGFLQLGLAFLALIFGLVSGKGD